MATNNVTNASPNVHVSGDTMTGTLVLNGAPSAPTQAATKAYVDGVGRFIKMTIPPISGHWYLMGPLFGRHSTSAVTSIPDVATGTLYYYPFFVTKDQTFTGIAVGAGGTVSGTTNMGIYADSGSMRPTGSPITNTQSGNVTITINSVISYTFSSPVTLTKGTYWGAATFSATNKIYGMFTGGVLRGYMGLAVNPSSTTINFNTVQYGWKESFVYSSTLPTVGSLTAVTKTSDPVVNIFVQAQ